MSKRPSLVHSVSFVVCLVLSLSLIASVSSPALAKPKTRYVATTGVDAGGCFRSNAPCRTVQYAVDVANEGETIKVAGGTYTGVQSRPSPPWYTGPTEVNQVVYLSKTVTIQGGYATGFSEPPDPEANATILDAEGQGRVLFIAGESSPNIAGFRLTGGDATGLGGHSGSVDIGGGVFIGSATATLTDSRLFGNAAAFGGGLALWYAGATLNENSITDNSSTDADVWGGGGGVYLNQSSATMHRNLISGNVAAGSGGGIHLTRSDATLEQNTFASNVAQYDGGGVYLNESPANIHQNSVTGNSAQDGGGLYLWYSPATLSQNVVRLNSADNGGGLFLWGSDARATNMVVADNQGAVTGSGLHVTSAAFDFRHITIADNWGGDGRGVYVNGDEWWGYGTLNLTNSIVANHSVGIYVRGGNTATLDSTLWNGNSADWGGTGTINHANDYTGDPAFIDPGNGDFHIGAASAALDVGVDAGVAVDIDGDTRPQGEGYDLGADERASGCPVPLTSVSISGPTEGSVNIPYTFDALVSPSDASEPIAFTWFPEPQSGQGTSSAIYSWADAGVKTISLTAENCGGLATDSHQISIGGNQVHVGDITMRDRARPGGRYLVLASVLILDQNNLKVNGVTVSVQWTLPDGSLQDQQADTGKQGTAQFQVESDQAGIYQVCVQDVVKTGWLYDPEQNAETCESLTVP